MTIDYYAAYETAKFKKHKKLLAAQQASLSFSIGMRAGDNGKLQWIEARDDDETADGVADFLESIARGLRNGDRAKLVTSSKPKEVAHG